MSIFDLKKNIHFHDDPCFPDGKGRELTADDVLDGEYYLSQVLNCDLNDLENCYVNIAVEYYHMINGPGAGYSSPCPTQGSIDYSCFEEEITGIEFPVEELFCETHPIYCRNQCAASKAYYDYSFFDGIFN